ncbi:RloB family protein [Maricaulis parjimensis]|uniref:RloB family protein n=1 Tax=Maricaulis parjimensis TaxID=144023 RepID=UPI0023AF7EB3|nr:RloB family protein [Maricaulis parjimensis]
MARRSRKKSLKRRQGNTPELDQIWVYAEGEKTEPLYLEGLKRDLGLGNITIKKVGSKTAPSTLLATAQRHLKNQGQFAPDFVYLVFDHDNFECFDQVIAECRSDKKISAIPSDPCFEYWLLLHVTMTTRSFASAAEVINELRKHEVFRTYTKTTDGVYEAIRHLTEDAIRNANTARSQIRDVDAVRPMTLVDKLVQEFWTQSERMQAAQT